MKSTGHILRGGHDLAGVALGLICVALGLALFIQGLELGLFPLGEAIAHAFARKGSAG